jgi:hypothetical protein
LRGKTIIIDFDGVINSYRSGWLGDTSLIPDPPVSGVKKAIDKLRKDYRVVVYSSRCNNKGGVEAIKKYLNKHSILVDEVVKEKVPAFVQIDDRAITFNGKWDDNFIEKIKDFRPWTTKK